MRATWLTSSVAGAVFGIVAGILSASESGAADVVIFATFLATIVPAVLGIAQYREMVAAQKARGLRRFGVLAEPEDFRRFYLPVWGRMLVWFFAAGVSGTTAIALAR